jgi:hypothetical protein
MPVRDRVDPGFIVRLEGLSQLKKINDLFGIRSRYLQACSIVPQPTTLSRALFDTEQTVTYCIEEYHIETYNVWAVLRFPD